jgi:choline dehydrogenase
MDLNIKDGRRFSVVHGYLLPALHRENLTLITGAHADKIKFDGKRCAGVKFRLNDEVYEVRAEKETILAAGAIDSPRLLMLSGVGDPDDLHRHDINVVSGVRGVGQNLQDRALLRTFAAESSAPISKEWRVESHLNLRTRKAAAAPDIQVMLVPGSLFARDTGSAQLFTLQAGLMQPESRGSVKLNSADPDASLLIDPNYLSAESDVDALVEAVDRCNVIASANGLLRWRKKDISEIPIERDVLREYIRKNANIYAHPVGTCAMGVDDQSVVDPSLHVHGVTGLRVADASVMPKTTSGNTNAPTIVIAEKAAQMILQTS